MPAPFTLTVQFSNPAPGANPQNPQQLVDMLNALLTAGVTGTYLPYVVGSTPPAAEDQDKLWGKLDGGGRPIALMKYYGGHWRRFYTGLPKELRYFNGNPATYFDGTGKGIVEGDWDGWALCNGSNGTPNMSDKFIVIGKVDDGSGYDEGTNKWTSHVSGANDDQGGAATVTLTSDNTYIPARGDLTVGKLSADGNAPNAVGGLYGANESAGSVTLITADSGNTTPDAIPILPPYYATAIAMFIGFS